MVSKDDKYDDDVFQFHIFAVASLQVYVYHLAPAPFSRFIGLFYINNTCTYFHKLFNLHNYTHTHKCLY